METTHLIPTSWGYAELTSRGSMLSRLLLPTRELKAGSRLQGNADRDNWFENIRQAINAYFSGQPIGFLPAWSDPELTETYKLAQKWWNQSNSSDPQPQLLLEVSLDLSGTPAASRKILAAAAAIPYGCTISYSELSHMVYGDYRHARVVGSAMRINPIPLIIPCHRVVAKSGIGGFSGGTGVDYKEQMLALEQRSLI